MRPGSFLAAAAALLLIVTNSSAQTVPNASFENWTIDNDGTDSLIGWTSSNSAYQGSVPQWLYKSTSPYSGSFAAQINSVGFGFISAPVNGILVNGDAFIEFSMNPQDHFYRSGGGTPVTGKPTSLSGYYKYEVVQNDQAFGMAVLFKYNSATGARDTVGKGTMLMNPAPSWQPFTININDMMPSVMPDSVLTIFWASDTAYPTPYQALYLDEFTLDYTTGVSETDLEVQTDVFPNPAGDAAWLSFMMPSHGTVSLQVYDAQGRATEVVYNDELPAGKHSIPLRTDLLSSGLYYYKLTAGAASGSGKLLVER